MVGEAAYFCDWYNEPIRFQRSIIIIMTRTKHPVQISLRPLGILSMEMFATVRADSIKFWEEKLHLDDMGIDERMESK
jgi:hypothetical protein